MIDLGAVVDRAGSECFFATIVDRLVIEVRGEWQDAGKALTPLALLTADSRLQIASPDGKASSSIRLRFLPGLCEKVFDCGDGTSCEQPIMVKDIVASLPDSCRQGNEISDAFLQFFDPAKAGELALPSSRGGLPEDEDDGPALQEAVLFADGGRIELTPLFRGGAAGTFWLQFCPPGPALVSDCADSPKEDRVEVKMSSDAPQPAAFAKPEGLYRVRLWKMTPRGPQSTEQIATALVGTRLRYGNTQAVFSKVAVAHA